MRDKPKMRIARALIIFGILGIFFHLFPSLLLISGVISIVLGIILLP